MISKILRLVGDKLSAFKLLVFICIGAIIELLSISLLLFYAFAMQCMSTLAIVKKETNSWKWPILQFIIMTALAYFISLISFQILS